MSDVHQKFRVDLDRTLYNTSLGRMESDTRSSATRTVNEFKRIGDGYIVAARSMSQANSGLSRSFAAGNVANQFADVAVQLQNGTKFATVFAQQGSQMAAAFGPSGAILGGAIAIGAAIYSWATNAELANKKFAEGEARLKGMQQATAALMSGAKSDQAAAFLSGIENPHARAIAEENISHDKRIESIQADAAKSGDAAAARIATEEAEKAHEAKIGAIKKQWEADIARDRMAFENKLEGFRERGRQADKQLAEMNLTPAQKLDLARANLAAIQNRTRLDTTKSNLNKEQEIESQAKESEARFAVATAEKEVNEDNAKKQEAYVKWATDFENKKNERNEKLQEKNVQWMELMEKREKDAREFSRMQAEQDLAVQTETADRINARAQQIRAGISQSDIRKASGLTKEQRRAISEEIDSEDRARRRAGLGGLTEEEKRDRREARKNAIGVDKRKDEFKLTLSDQQMDKFAQKNAEAVIKLLGK